MNDHAITLAAVFVATAASAGECERAWDPTFGVPGANAGVVFDFALHDDGAGDGPQLYASGNYTAIGGVDAARIARWDGAAWHPLGSGLSNAECYAVASYGGDLHAAGFFDSAGGVEGTAKLARWDGAEWHSIGAMLASGSNQIWDLVTWDDGNGEALYIAGNYLNIGGVNDAHHITKWDGAEFTPLGAPIGGNVALIVLTAYAWDDGTGDALYVGGRFLTIDGVSANRIARWDGESWTALGSGITGPGATPSVMAMIAFDDGGGEALYVAGQTFNLAGGVPVNRIARWDGKAWSSVGDGFANGIVWGLQVFDDGTGAALYASGTFTLSGKTQVDRLARWNGESWEPVDGGANASTYHAIVVEDCTGRAMYVGGQYTAIGGVTANRIARVYPCPAERIPGDVDGNGVVNFDDLLLLLAAWGDCPEECACPADFDESGTVDFDDLLLVLANWS